MKEMNSSEAQLSSWAPRRPSAGLKRRIFAAPARRLAASVWLLQLAPAAACLLAIIASFNQSNSLSSGSYHLRLMGGMPGSNQIVCIPGLYVQEHNDVSNLTFEWTNRNGSTSSISSFSPDTVNIN